MHWAKLCSDVLFTTIGLRNLYLRNLPSLMGVDKSLISKMHPIQKRGKKGTTHQRKIGILTHQKGSSHHQKGFFLSNLGVLRWNEISFSAFIGRRGVPLTLRDRNPTPTSLLACFDSSKNRSFLKIPRCPIHFHIRSRMCVNLFDVVFTLCRFSSILHLH